MLNAIYAKTGLVTYHGPHFSTFGFEQETAYTQRAFWACVTDTAPIEAVASQAAGSYRVLCPGTCEGTAIGGNLCTLNLLQGTPYMPDLRGAVLFLEDDNIMGEYFPYEFDRNLESLLQQPGAQEIRGIVFGRFHESCRMTDEMLRAIIREKIPHDIPVISGVDFGHVTPMLTFPIGGTVHISAQPCGVQVQLLTH